ncbi:phosphatidate cytidylyltransferase [Marinobacterium sediminicola]|uniref:Phosphatidate cytidylyltransferase n=1 Tax=Marinobacterium sediminicola TaxID=518898 RepID=A0ABY1S061_9GAMM|nr:phosphatidate cytidylyltransferase [Marinobacterium sediminicola]ULG69688.1 phosphatidate cytidylyltransferase [Marinobacterium sediminicola]SMR74584.1 phosphatidate cytidylyltransferase [Marinobacterium sediminicola]
MLKQRILTAVLLAPVALAALFLLPQQPFEWVAAAVFLYGAWEWGNLCRLQSLSRMIYVLALAGLMLVVGTQEWLQPWSLGAALVFWVLALFMVRGYPGSAGWCRKQAGVLIGVLVLVPSWFAMTALRAQEQGLPLLLMLLMLVWGADIGAYAAGKTFGRNKLMPLVSPGKTREGLWGGLTTCALVGVLFSIWLELGLSESVYVVLLSIMTGLVSVLGDLLESLFKRERGIKDSGKLLPGHGGVLDRIDSLTAAAPVFLVGLYFLQGA